jgi:hypothetical protein
MADQTVGALCVVFGVTSGVLRTHLDADIVVPADQTVRAFNAEVRTGLVSGGVDEFPGVCRRVLVEVDTRFAQTVPLLAMTGIGIAEQIVRAAVRVQAAVVANGCAFGAAIAPIDRLADQARATFGDARRRIALIVIPCGTEQQMTEFAGRPRERAWLAVWRGVEFWTGAVLQ